MSQPIKQPIDSQVSAKYKPQSGGAPKGYRSSAIRSSIVFFVLNDLSKTGFAVVRSAIPPAMALRAASRLIDTPWWQKDTVWVRRTERIAQILHMDAALYGGVLDAMPSAAEN